MRACRLAGVARATATKDQDERLDAPELRASRLAYAEQLFRSEGPASVSARVDRAYRNQAGVVTLVELKTREADRAYLSDVIELSAQRFALSSQTGEFVNAMGYVASESPVSAAAQSIK